MEKKAPSAIRIAIYALLPFLWLGLTLFLAWLAFYLLEPTIPELGNLGEGISLSLTLGQIREVPSGGDYAFLIDGLVHRYEIIDVGERFKNILKGLSHMGMPYSPHLEGTSFALSALISLLVLLSFYLASSLSVFLRHLPHRPKTYLSISLFLLALSLSLSPLSDWVTPAIMLLAIPFFCLFRLSSSRPHYFRFSFLLVAALYSLYSISSSYGLTPGPLHYLPIAIGKGDARLAFTAILFFGLLFLIPLLAFSALSIGLIIGKRKN